MLSGIKTGKRKRKAKNLSPLSVEPPPEHSETVSAAPTSSNQSEADQLRRSLLTPCAAATVTDSGVSASLPHQLLERSGRIKEATKANHDEEHAVAFDLPAAASSKAEALFSSGGDGYHSMSTDEALARNVVRLGKKRRQKMNSNIDSDEEEHRLISMMLPSTNPAAKKGRDDEKAKRRAISREHAKNDRQDQITGKCWWWLDSPKFAKHRLLALGNHVCLVMAPLNLSLTPGQHFYLVPIKHAESLAGCEEEVWDEIARFQQSLRALFQKEGQGLLFSETVLPTKSFWQTKMEAVPLKRSKWLDSELFFKSTLTEQADEFGGTHIKLMSTDSKGLRRTVPKKNFPYFYVEWDSPSQGFAQLIESSYFPPDFAADTVAGMTGSDPIRFQRKKKFSAEQERKHILEFLEKWQAFDWTSQLDG